MSTENDQVDIEGLKLKALAATPGPWDYDTEKNDGEYGHFGPDSKAGFNSYAIHCEAGTLFDTLNSDMASVHEEWDEDSFYAWDDVGRCNAEFVAAANPAAILSLIAEVEGLRRQVEEANGELDMARRDRDAFVSENCALRSSIDARVEQLVAHFEATHRELWTPAIAEEIRALKSPSPTPAPDMSPESTRSQDMSKREGNSYMSPAPEQPKTMTMGERYGDGSDCISCNGCHMCVTCGDCKCSQPSSVAMTDVWLDYLDVDRILEIGKQFFTYEPVQFGLGTCVKGSIGSLVQFAHAVRDEVVLQSSTASSTAQEASNQGELHGFPERDPSKPAEQQGIFRKFDVRRVDGSDQPGGKHYGCRYFVLDLNHDQHAPAAMRAYAYACCETHPQLSADILAEFATLSASPSDADKRDADFFRGVIAALGALRPHSSHGDTLHDEIVISVGKERLYAIAEPEDVEWAGLDPEFYAAISRMRDGREKP